jgi:predicted ATPase/Tfp pilus assembly protein PilF
VQVVENKKFLESRQLLAGEQSTQSPTKLYTLSGLRLEHTNFTRPKPLLLLAYLCIEGKKDKRFLAELFWPGASNHLNSLAKALSQLRQVGVIDNDDTHAWATISSDVNEFLDALEARDLGAVITLYQDSFLSGFYLPDWGTELEEWIYTTREFLAAQMREVWLELAEASRHPQEITRYAERAYEQEVTLEPEVIQRLYKLLSSTAHAAKLKEEAKEFGVVVEQPKTIVSNLPVRGTSFIGRDIERLELAELLSQEDVRMVTVVGQGGVGKTRLALEVARELQENFPDGVVFFPVENLTTPEQMLAGLATALSIQLTEEDCTEQLPRIIGNKRVLLFMDSMEYQVEGAHKGSVFLARCPNLKILNTSRVRLNLEEEWVYTLEGFSVPEQTTTLEEAQLHDAISLFVQRAKRVKPGFTLSEACLPFVLDICERLQGLPLGIELAASWVKVLSCQEIAEHLSDADFLTTTTNNVPEKHQSLRHVFEGSWQLLSGEEQSVLSKLSVFRGGFTREVAREVAGATLTMLARLVDKSLLRVAANRYDQHPLLHAFAAEKLTDVLTVEQRHAAFFLAFALSSEKQLHGPQQKVVLEKLFAELDNFRTALNYAKRTNNPEFSLELAAALHRFWMSRNLASEGRAWLSEALDRLPQLYTYSHAKALFASGTLAWQQGDFAEATSALRQSLELYQTLGDLLGEARTAGNLAIVATEQGNYSQARHYYESSLELSRRVNNVPSAASALHNLGILASQLGNFAEAKTRYLESLPLFRELGNTSNVAANLNSLARVSWEQGDLTLTEVYAAEALPLHETLNSYLGASISHLLLARVAVARGNSKLALEHYRTATSLQKQSGDKPGLICSLEGVAHLLHETEPERATWFYSIAETAREHLKFFRPPAAQEQHRLELAELHDGLGEEAFKRVWAKGLVTTLEEAVKVALKPRETT